LYRPPITDLNVLQERKETNRVCTFLAALNSNYESIQAHILLSIEKQSFDSVIFLVRQEVTRRVAMAFDSNPKAEAHAFSAQLFGVGKGKGKGRLIVVTTTNGNVTLKKMLGASSHLRPKRNQNETVRGRFFSKILDGGEMEKKGLTLIKGDSNEAKLSRNEGEQLDRLENLLSSLLSPKLAGSQGDPGLVLGLSQTISNGPITLSPNTSAETEKINRASPKFKKNGAETVAFSLEKINDNNYLIIGLSTKNTSQKYTKCVLDSGVTDHMTGNQSLLKNYRTIISDQYFIVINNERIKIKRCGYDYYFFKEIPPRCILC
jgi:hypothetical protein